MDNILNWWACSDLNRGPSDYESPALTAELQARRSQNGNRVYFGAGGFGGKLILQSAGNPKVLENQHCHFTNMRANSVSLCRGVA
jgi:hypothetical protein